MRVGGQVLAVTMRTPGNDVDLVHGFLLSEGVIATRDDVSVVRYQDVQRGAMMAIPAAE